MATSNPTLADAPCLRCGHALTWRRDKRGCPYAYCQADAGGCGAKITLGRSDPFPAPLAARPADPGGAPAPASDPPAPAPAPQPEPEPDDDGRRKRRNPFALWD